MPLLPRDELLSTDGFQGGVVIVLVLYPLRSPPGFNKELSYRDLVKLSGFKMKPRVLNLGKGLMGMEEGLIMIEGGRSQSWRVWSTIPYITYETLRGQISTIGSQTTHQRKIMNVGKEPVMRRWGTEERQRDDSGCITLTRAHLLLVELGFFFCFLQYFY